MDVVTVGVVAADVMVRPVDGLPARGTLALVPHLELHLGGLAGVTATVLCQLGTPAAFIGKLGQDGFGDFIFNALESNGVNTERVRREPGMSTSATLVLISDDGERTFLHHVGANAAITEADVDFDFVGQAKVLHWGGPSITPGLDGEPIGRVMRAAKERGLTTSMDTCFDGKGVWFPHIEHALPHLDIVMSSLEEARHYTGQDTPEGIADFYLSFGVKAVMVKLGPGGVYVKDGQVSQRIPAHSVQVVDSTGAGDAACAGFLHGYLRDWDVVECGRLANAVGGLTVQSIGGAEAIRSLGQVTDFMKSNTAD